MIKQISHISYLVSDMKKSLEFYCDILGFEKAFEILDDDGQPWLNYLKICEGQFIELFFGGETKSLDIQQQAELQYKISQRICKSGQDFGKTIYAGYLHLCLEVDDIFKLSNHFKENGIRIEIEPKLGKDRNYQCWVNDPDGNKIEFMQIDPESPQAKKSEC